MNERITFDQAQKLKSIGYDEPVDMRYVGDAPVLRGVIVSDTVLRCQQEIAAEKNRGVFVQELFDRVNENENEYAAPTMASLIEWFEDTFGFHMGVGWNPLNEKYEYNVRWDQHCSAGGTHIDTRREAMSRIIDLTLIHILSKERNTTT